MARTSTGLGAELMLATFTMHGIAHVVRGVSPPLVLAAGAVLAAMMIGVLAARWRGRRAARTTLVCGVLAGVGLLVVHFVPMWAPLSEPWLMMHVHPVWWVTLCLAVPAAFWAAATARYELRREAAHGRAARTGSALRSTRVAAQQRW